MNAVPWRIAPPFKYYSKSTKIGATEKRTRINGKERKRAMTDSAVLEKHAKRNEILTMLLYTGRHIATSFASGSLMQTFLAALGFAPALIYVHTTVLQAVCIATIMLTSKWADKGNVIKRSTLCQIPLGLMFIVYIPIAIMREATLPIYALLIGAGVIQQVSMGLHAVCEYKQPYYVYKPSEYGRIMSLAGGISSFVNLVIGAVITLLVEKHGYLTVAPYIMVSAILFVVIAILANAGMRRINLNIEAAPAEEKKPSVSILRYGLFWRFLPANILRGISSGVTVVLATIALEMNYGEALATSLVTMQSIATLSSCAVMSLTMSKFSYKFTVLAGSILTLAFPLLLIKSSPLFLAVYVILMFGRTLIDYGVPALLVTVIPVELAGPYNAWRMVLHNIGTLIATLLASLLPHALIFIIAAAAQIISGMIYYRTVPRVDI